MRSERILKTLGEPSLKLGFFSLWVHNRPHQQSSSNDFDKDWLTVTVLYESQVVSFTDNGTFLMVSSLERFLKESVRLYETLSGTAELSSYEPNVKVLLRAQSSGHIEAVFEFEPNLQTKVKCEEDMDQTYLKELIRELSNVIHSIKLGDG